MNCEDFLRQECFGLSWPNPPQFVRIGLKDKREQAVRARYTNNFRDESPSSLRAIIELYCSRGLYGTVRLRGTTFVLRDCAFSVTM